MFEQLRASFRAMLDGARSPDDRREVLSDMKQSIVRARLGLDDLRQGIDVARRRVDEARGELATIRRRRALAASIADHETVEIAGRFEALQGEKVSVLERKLETQQAELTFVEHEVAEMTSDLRRAMDGVPLRDGPRPTAGAPAAGTTLDGMTAADPLGDERALGDEIDALGRRATRASREDAADARLAELKRRLGK